MAILKVLGEAVDATAVAAQTAVDLDSVTPFIVGGAAISHVVLTGVTGSPVIKIQTSPDNSTWTDAVSVSAVTNSVVMDEIALQRYVRLNVTTGGSAGTVAAYLTV